MINVVSKSGSIAQYIRGTSVCVAGHVKTCIPDEPIFEKKKPIVPSKPVAHNTFSLQKLLPTGDVTVRSGLGVTTHVRLAHSDINVPDFSKYRRTSVKSPASQSKDTDESRKAFTYLVVGGGAVATAYAAKTVVTQFVTSMSASADVLALAKVEIKLSDIPEGKSVTFKWRGKPLFIRHRTSEEISKERSVSLTELRDPQKDEERVTKPEWLILIGVCTHLGCVPIANAGDYGGYYCPCHGSHYDNSGRIRKGPAPLNLEIPPYEFVDEGTLIVG